jgi:hypothetical protein
MGNTNRLQDFKSKWAGIVDVTGEQLAKVGSPLIGLMQKADDAIQPSQWNPKIVGTAAVAGSIAAIIGGITMYKKRHP